MKSIGSHTRETLGAVLARSKGGARLAGFGVLALGLAGTLACLDRPMKRAVPDPVAVWKSNQPQRPTRDVDLLFVIDDSISMGDVQELLRAQFGTLMSRLREMRGGLPDVHIGVVSTDLGAGIYGSGFGCPEPGDAGKLLTGSCAQGPTGKPYIVDVEPKGCAIEKRLDDRGRLLACEQHACGQQHCTEPDTVLEVDALGCPRCRNYSGRSLEQLFSCMADLGVSGCGFEQPLEAMRRALSPDNAANGGFARQDALLSVVIITDEDDCSAKSPELFNDTDTSLGSTLGPLSFRCFEFGITCDQNGRQPGVREHCVPREDPGAMLVPVSEYVAFLQSLRSPEQVLVAAIAGDTDGGPVVIQTNEYGDPEPAFSCTTDTGGAAPALRIHDFVAAFNEPDAMSWAFSSVCSPSYASALEGVASRIAVLLDSCPPGPLDGCADPFGVLSNQGAGACSTACEPQCTVAEVQAGSRSELPRCLEVCPSGPCAGNTDPAAAYAGGHPEARDPGLPVAACWHVAQNRQCGEARGAEVVLSRREDPPAGARLDILCRTLLPAEQLCNDGEDNDGDCLIDDADPDCRQ